MLVKSIKPAGQLNAGIKAGVNVNMQSVQAPEQVQAAFEATLKAGQDRDRLRTKARPTPAT